MCRWFESNLKHTSMIILDKLYCQLNEELNFNSEIKQIFGIGTHNKLYQKFGFSHQAHCGIIKIVENDLEFDIEYYILKNRNVSFPLRQEIKDNIRKKLIKRTYQGLRHAAGLPVHGQRTHSNSKTCKKTHNTNIVLSTGFKQANLLKKKEKKPLKKKQSKKLVSKKK